MRLIHTETGAVVEQGAILHMTSGQSINQAWRFERIIPNPDGHRIHCTRSHPKMGRLPREFHPDVFGCHVAADTRWYAHCHRMVRWLYASVSQAFLLTAGGIVAWLVAEYGNAEWGGILSMLGIHAA